MTRRPLTLLLVACILTVAARADAVPYFARRYRTSCRTCHEWSFPYLNSWGERFRQNGYQLPDGAEDPARAARMIEPGTIGEHSAIFATPPLSVRGRVLAEWRADVLDDLPVGVDAPYARMIGGGSLYEDVSLIFAADVAPNPALHFATVGFHNLLGEGNLSIVAGKLLIEPMQRIGHRSITRLGNPIGSVGVGHNPFMLEGEHWGVSLSGRPQWGPLTYELALTRGSPGAVRAEPGTPSSLFGRLTLGLIDEARFGTFAFAGRARLHMDQDGIEREWDDRFVIAGGDALVRLFGLTFYGAGLVGTHVDPLGQGDHVRYLGARAELLVPMTDSLLAIARYDAIESKADETLRKRLVTLHAGYLVLTSLRLSLEGTIDLRDREQSLVTALLEAAL